jgi:hypothetical protein
MSHRLSGLGACIRLWDLEYSRQVLHVLLMGKLLIESSRNRVWRHRASYRGCDGRPGRGAPQGAALFRALCGLSLTIAEPHPEHSPLGKLAHRYQDLDSPLLYPDLLGAEIYNHCLCNNGHCCIVVGIRCARRVPPLQALGFQLGSNHQRRRVQ